MAGLQCEHHGGKTATSRESAGATIQSFLLITFIDLTMENQRTHHVIRFFRERIKQIVVLTQTAESGDQHAWGDIRSLFCFRIQVERQAGVVEVKVAPPLNYRPGFGMRLMGHGDIADPSRVKGLKRVMGTMLRRAGLLRHFMVTPAMLLGYLLSGCSTFDVCLVEGAWEGVVGVLLRKLGLVRLLVYEDIDYWGGEGRTLLEKILAALERFSLNQADLRISSAELLGGLRRTQLGKEVHVVPNGAELSLFRSAREKRPHPPTLVFVGDVLNGTGLEMAIEALPAIARQVPDIRLLVIGAVTTALQIQLNKQAERVGAGGRVVFAGIRPHREMPDLLRECDIGLANYKPTTFWTYSCSLKVLEYLAAGLPVIGTEGTETGRILRRALCGEVIPYGDKDAFIQTATAILTDRERYRWYSVNAVRESARYEWDHLLEREYQLVDQAYREHRGGLS